MIAPGSGKPIPGVRMPGELYRVLDTPAPLAGMRLPRRDFPWPAVAAAGFEHLVSLHPGAGAVAPLTLLASVPLEDLVGDGQPRDPEGERTKIAGVVSLVVAALRRGEGVLVHCIGGRGRTGTVLGCVLRELGEDPDAIAAFLDRVHKARGKPGWPESTWQEALVRAWPVRG